jgi:glyoxylase-like metal-dependent hydrolase (beta-lactamase superfamily II)
VAASAFPLPVEIDGVVLPDVRWCGWTGPASYGAWSWLIERPEGNLLVDSPRASPALAAGITARGGISRIILSHRDDVADHAFWHERFSAPRLAHAAEHLTFAEQQVSGTEPITLDHDLLLIPVPGHTAGSLCLLYRQEILFTGDHLWWSPPRGRLQASRTYCWHDWDEQLASLRRLLDLPVRWVLPGHGAPWRAPHSGAFREELERSLAELTA